MIIDLEQTASNIAQQFDVYCDGSLLYAGELGSLFRIQSICLEDVNGDIVLEARFQMVSLKNYLPFGMATRGKQRRRNFRIYREEEPIASAPITGGASITAVAVIP